MIKNLSKKFLLIFSILAVVIFTVSSCYAYSWNTSDIKSDTYLDVAKSRVTFDLDNVNYRVVCFYDSYYSQYKYHFIFEGEGTSEGLFNNTYTKYVLNNGQYKHGIYNSDGVALNFYYQTVSLKSDGSLHQVYPTEPQFANHYTFDGTGSSSKFQLVDSTQIDYYYNNSLVYDAPDVLSLDFDYTLTGIKRGAVRLDVTGLDSSLRMYGYVGVKNNYEIGDTFDGSSVSEYLRLLTIYSDNSDLNCTLYRGEELVYYILDSNNVILDIGYISEMAKDYFLYGFNVDNGVDFEFLKDGQVYWSDSLTFKYSLNNSTQLTNNSIVSSVDNYIKISNTVTNVTCDAIAYLNGNEIATASVVKKNNLSSLSITVYSSYYEVDTLFNKNTSVYTVSNLFLEGTDENGNTLDFSRYRVRWSIPTWLELKQITLAGNNYSKYNGTSSYFSSVGSLNLDLKIYEIVDSHKAPFDITLEILNGNGDVVLTKVINSDTIVKEEIDRNENNVDKDDFEIIDSPNYTGGSNSYPGSNNIHNWTVDDYVSFVGTNNTIFNFFWAFLNNMPTWISTPLYILLLGLALISIYKFIRG